MHALLPAESKASAVAARRRSTLILIGAFWVLTFAVLSLRAAVIDYFPFNVIAPRRLITSAFGAGLCLLMVFVLGKLRNRSFPDRIAVGLAGALLTSITHALFATLLNRVLLPLPNNTPFDWADTAQWMMVWFGYYLAWTGTHLAMVYHWEAEDRRNQAAILQNLAQEARIAAFRYQINPHFLFNTLNSISALVIEGRNGEAEAMLLHLSTFLRSTLGDESDGEVDLEREIALQRLYLAIEEARFSDRMRVEIDVPEALSTASVPALILQPLIENAVRYGVGGSEGLTTIRITGALRAGEVLLAVENDGTADVAGKSGSGLGLANVRARLNAHYGAHGTLTAGPRDGGGFRAEIAIPWRPHP
ncbi:MAG: histidine kinase [Sphingomonas sp.]